MNNSKYLITLWIDWYDYNERVFQKFNIEYQTTDLDEANRKLDKIVRERVNEGLREFESFAVKEASTEKRPIMVDVNKNNKVIRKERRKIGNGSGHNCIYYDFDIIELPAKKRLGANLFNLKNCKREVGSFFKYRYNQC